LIRDVVNQRLLAPFPQQRYKLRRNLDDILLAQSLLGVERPGRVDNALVEELL
jgi:hypothetical protein